MAISFHQSNKKHFYGLIFGLFYKLVAFAGVALLCYVHSFAAWRILQLFSKVTGRPPQYQPPKVQLPINLNFWFLNFYFFIFLKNFFWIF